MTLAYTTGTITLTNGSKAVTGIGTGWQTALIAGGVIYPDASGNALPIKTVNSNTSITLDVAWKGATGTYSYAIVRDTAYLQQLSANAQALATYIARLDSASLGALAALAGTLGAGKVPRGLTGNTMEWMTVTDQARALLDDTTYATMRATLELSDNQIAQYALGSFGTYVPTGYDFNTANAGDRGLYGNAGAINGPPVSGPGFWHVECQRLYVNATPALRQVATGYFTSGSPQPVIWVRLRASDGTWGTWGRVLTSSAVLGTIQAGGAAANGAIIEGGTNANGSYVRLLDGTQICWTADGPAQACTSLVGGGVYGAGATALWTFPIPFYHVSTISIQAAAQANNRWANGIANTTSSGGVRQYSPYSDAAALSSRLVATGRWYA